MKLLVKADDYALSDAVAEGILKGIRNGIITCTGLMTNLDGSEVYAKKMINEFPDFCMGIDINLVGGNSVTDPALIPHLTHTDGSFISSIERYQDPHWPEIDPYPYEETRLEVVNQIEKFIQFTGKKPSYIGGHSIGTPTIHKVIAEVADEYGLLNVDINQPINNLFVRPKGTYNKKPFPLEEQLKASPIDFIMNQIDDLKNEEYVMIGGHPGYVDNELFKRSSYTLIRIKDLEMVTSNRIKKWIIENDVELISFNDVKEMNV